MRLATELLAAFLVVLVVQAQARFAARGPHQAQRDLLARHIGQHVTVQSADGRCDGLVRRVSRTDVEVRVPGSEVRLPLARIDEVWQKGRLLARW